MGKAFVYLIAATFLIACSSETPPAAETVETKETPQISVTKAAETAQKAKELFAHQEGVWDSKWDWLDEKGGVIRSVEGTETFTYILDGAGQELFNDIPEWQVQSKALLTFSPPEGKIIFFSISPNGDYWLMKQNPLNGEMLSEPHKGADGTIQIIKFTTVRQTENEMDIVMESSLDNGATWTKKFNQYMRRRVTEP